MDYHIIIPARLASSRLPGKILEEISGKPLIQHVYENALLCSAKSVVVGVDDKKVFDIAKAFGATVCMTKLEHENGTDRLSEVVQQLGLGDDEIIVNIQGDEPLMPKEAVLQAVKAMVDHPDAAVATLCLRIQEQEEILDQNIVKVVLDKNNFALYFSRAPIPWDRTAFNIKNNPYYRHVGLYAYRAKTLQKYSQWEKSPLERIEMLEQLRVLWQGEKIHVSMINQALPPGIDTEEDLERFRKLIEA